MNAIFANWKTTLAGLLGFVPQLLSLFGHSLDPSMANAIQAVAISWVGILAHDAQSVKS